MPVKSIICEASNKSGIINITAEFHLFEFHPGWKSRVTSDVFDNQEDGNNKKQLLRC